MRVLLILSLSLFIAFTEVNGQWIQSEKLVGGSIANDMIEYQGSIYAAMTDHGVFKSEDHGNSWKQVIFSDVYHWSLGVFTLHKEQLIAASYGHLYKTSDGEIWTRVDIPAHFVRDIVSDGEMMGIATTGGIFISEDEGNTWNDINIEETAVDMLSITIKDLTIWAGSYDGLVFKTNNKGKTWNKLDLNSENEIHQIIPFEDKLYLNLGYEGILRSDDHGESWVNTMNSLSSLSSVSKLFVKDSVLFVFDNFNVYSSTDGGNSWVKSIQESPSHSVMSVLVTQNYIYVGTWGNGIYRNTLAVEQEWEAKNVGMNLIETNDILVEQNTIFLGADLSFVHTSEDEGINWSQKKDYYGHQTDRVWSLLYAGDYLFVGVSGGVQRSRDWGESWEIVNNGLSNTLVNELAVTQNFIFAGTDEKVFRSDDYGDHWVEKNEGITSGIKTIYADEGYVFVNTWNGLFMSEDNGDSWKRISTNLPDESIGEILLMDSILFVGTQNNGLYKTADFGSNWKPLNDKFVFSLVNRGDNIFMGSWDGTVLVSQDMGESWTNISEELPKAIISAIDFTDHYLIAGTRQPGHGIWRRALHEVVPPTLSFYSSSSDSSFLIGEPIFISADQVIKNKDSSSIDTADLQTLITLEDQQQENVNFIAQMDSSERVIKVFVENPVEGKAYIITVDTLYNLSGLPSSVHISKPFKAKNNSSPILEDIVLSEEVISELHFNISDFVEAFSDADGDALVKIMIKSLPEHGTLMLDNDTLKVDDEVYIDQIPQFIYIPKEGFSGMDQFSWNGSDGRDYAQHDAFIAFNVTVVTEISSDIQVDNEMLLYPNPVSEELAITLDNDFIGICKLELYDISGREIQQYTFTKTSFKEEVKVSLSDIQTGVYFLRITSSEFHMQSKLIKK